MYIIGNWHYVIPKSKRAPDGSLARGPMNGSAALVTSLGRARLGLGLGIELGLRVDR